MFYDLNVPYTANDASLARTVSFLSELGYDVVALSYGLSGKLPADLTCPIPSPLPFPISSRLRILRRCTLTLTSTDQNHRIGDLNKAYDILALRPVDEKTFMQACLSLDCDIISMDLSQRYSFFFKFPTISAAIERGIRFEICYSTGVGGDSSARRNLISNATQLIRASRGRGLIISSEAKSALACRGPWDAVNLAAVWGLGQERGYEAVCKEARAVVVTAGLKRSSYRGAVDVIYGGEKPEKPEKPEKRADGKKDGNKGGKGAKKEDQKDGGNKQPEPGIISKRQQKKQAHAARMAERTKQQGPATDQGEKLNKEPVSNQTDVGKKRKSEDPPNETPSKKQKG